MNIYTFGHGTAGEAELAALIRREGVRAVIDVRSVPKSRFICTSGRNDWRSGCPIWRAPTYAWRPSLGGFRSHAPIVLTSAAASGLSRLRRLHADGDLRDRPARLGKGRRREPTAIMCSETLWWRCHRRLIADALVLLHGVEVRHLALQRVRAGMHPGAPQPHRRRRACASYLTERYSTIFVKIKRAASPGSSPSSSVKASRRNRWSRVSMTRRSLRPWTSQKVVRPAL